MSQDTDQSINKIHPENSTKTCETRRREYPTKEQKPMNVDQALEIWERLAVVDLAIQGIERGVESGFGPGVDQVKALRYFSDSAIDDLAEFLSRLDDNGLYFRDYRKDGLGIRDAEQSQNDEEDAA